MPFTARLACSITALVAVGGLFRLVQADEKPTKNLVETATAAGTFRTLVKALADADLAKTLEGEGQSPIYAFLTKGREAPSWNFCKYLVGKDGKVVQFYASAVKPGDAELRKAIEAALK